MSKRQCSVQRTPLCNSLIHCRGDSRIARVFVECSQWCWFDKRGDKVTPLRFVIPTLSAWQASLSISEWGMRTCVCFANQLKFEYLDQKQRGAFAPLCFWSRWQDSNLRLLRPEELHTWFLSDFCDFSVLLCLKPMLSDALVRTVSTQSKSVDGQRCGQAELTTFFWTVTIFRR